MRGLAVAALALAGCVGDAVVARAPVGAADAGVDPVLRVEVTATAEDNASARSAFAASVEVFATRGGAAADATLSVARGGAALTVRTLAPGHYVAALGDYAAGAVLTVVTADGARHEVALTAPAPFRFLFPDLHERVMAGAAVPVGWTPSGDAEATLLAPGGPLPVDDTGGLSIAAGTFAARGDHIIRLRRTTTSALDGLPAGSTLSVAVVNSVEVMAE